MEGQLSNLKRSMVQFARPRKYAPDQRMMAAAGAVHSNGFQSIGRNQLPEGLGDGTPLFSDGGNIAVGPRGQRQQNGSRGRGGYGGQGGYGPGGYASQPYDSQRSQPYGGSQSDYVTQGSFGSMSIGDTQHASYASQGGGYGYASQPGYDSQHYYGAQMSSDECAAAFLRIRHTTL